MRKYWVLFLAIGFGLSAHAQHKAPHQVLQNISKKEINHVLKNTIQKAEWKGLLSLPSTSANKRSSVLLDSVETYSFDGTDSLLSGLRLFSYDGQDRLEDDAAYDVDDNGEATGSERTSYEYGPGLYAEITHFWDVVANDWDYNEKVELRANLGRGDTVFARLEYSWNTLTDTWDGFKAQAIVDKDVTGGSYEVFFTFVYDLPNSEWVFETLDSTFTDNNGNVTHEKFARWNTTTSSWDTESEVKSTFKQRPNNRIRIRESWNADSSKYLLTDSFVFKYVQDTILESGYYFGINDNDVFDTLSYLTSVVNGSKDTVKQTYYRRDSTGNGYVAYLGRTFTLDGNGQLIGYEEMDLSVNEGISKSEFSKTGNNEVIIEYEWSDGSEQWVLSEKQEYEYNTKNLITLNSFYSYNENTQKWEGVEKRTYVFASDNETVLNRTEYAWDNSNKTWVLESKRDFTYDGDNDPILIVHSDYENGNWVIDEKDFFYYGSIPVGGWKYEVEIIEVYPNPVSDLLWFKTGIQNVKVFDMNGRMVMAESQSTSLDVSQLPAGVYQVRAQIGEQPVAARFIKQ